MAKKFIGNAKPSKNYDYILNVSFTLEDLPQNIQPFTKKDGTVVHYVNLQMSEMKTPDKYGNTHSIYYHDDTNEPAPEGAYAGAPEITAPIISETHNHNVDPRPDDIPF